MFSKTLLLALASYVAAQEYSIYTTISYNPCEGIPNCVITGTVSETWLGPGGVATETGTIPVSETGSVSLPVESSSAVEETSAPVETSSAAVETSEPATSEPAVETTSAAGNVSQPTPSESDVEQTNGMAKVGASLGAVVAGAAFALL